jgi:hydroxymethylpyrimidine pyrophosphatase-like HAD family hydrolase
VTASTGSPRALVAVDLDGTLLRDDKTVADADARAIAAAAEHGIAVTLATGRLTTGALPTARQLRLTTPIVCADGGLLVDVVTGAALERRTISIGDTGTALAALAAHGLVPFVFSADAIHCEPEGEVHRAIVDTWSREIVIHPSLGAASAWKDPAGIALTVGIGPRAAVERASEHLRRDHADTFDTVHFGLGGLSTWAVRSLPRGCDKGDMLGRLAARLGLARTRVAAVGDWFNDVGMFKYAGRSFAMGQAPKAVRDVATDSLTSTSATGGGVAEAIATLLAAWT